MQQISFWSLFLSLVSCLAVFNEQPLDDNLLCENSCPVDTTNICLTFLDAHMDFHDAGLRCKMNKRILLPERVYNQTSRCINKYMKDLNQSATWVWLDPVKTQRLNSHIVFNTSGTYVANGEYASHPMICITQGKAFKTFNLTVSTPNLSREYDLLSPPWHSGQVFNEVCKGESLKLTCEIDGIPTPTFILKTNNIPVKFEIDGKSHTIEIPTIICGDAGIFTCEEENIDGLKKTIRIHVQCPDVTSTPEISYKTTSDKRLSQVSTKDNSVNNNSHRPRTVGSSDNTELTDDVHWSVAIPVALATTAVVLAICCITCILCAVIVYRKRDTMRCPCRFQERDYIEVHSSTNLDIRSTAIPRHDYVNVRPIVVSENAL